jgi:hypothetical protein
MQSSRERGWVVGILQRIFERHRHRVGDDDGQHDVVEGLVQHDVDRGLAHRHVHSETPQRRRWRLPSSSSSSLGSSSLSLPRRKERFGTSLKARALFPRIRAWIKVAAASASCC